MPTVTAQRIPKKTTTSDEIITLFCYYFPQYTFNKAKTMPYRRITQMLTVVRKEEARKMYEWVQAIAAPHSTKGKMVKKMIEYYKGIMEE